MAADLNWYVKQKASRNNATECDLFLSVSSDKNKKAKAVYVTFYNQSWQQITESGYLVFAVRGNKVYFKEADPSCGYKLSHASANTDVLNVRIGANLHDALMRHRGPYIMFKDKELGLYYIELH